MYAKAIASKSSMAIALGVAVFLAASIARAAPTDPVDATIEEGVRLRTEGKHAEALELFKKAHEEHPSARTLAQMGLAEGSLHRWVDAESHLTAALSVHDTPWIENRRNREALEQALASVRGHIGTLLVIGPAGAEVSVAGSVVGRLPLAAPLHEPEGPVHVRGTALGHKAAEVDATVTGGAETTVTLDLGPPLPPPVSAVPIVDDEPPLPPSPTRWKAWTGGSLLAVSAAALIAGSVWLAIDNKGTCTAPAGARCEHLYDTKTQGWLGIGVGVAAGAGGGLLLWQGTHSETRIGLVPGGFQLAGRF
jgi:hypothetical protein